MNTREREVLEEAQAEDEAGDRIDPEHTASPGEPIYTSRRGGWVDGRTFHGLYAGRWIAWSGAFLAYGSTEADAVARLVADMADPQEERRKPMAWYSATEAKDERVPGRDAHS